MDRSYPILLCKQGYYTGFAGKFGFRVDKEPFDAFKEYFDDFAGSSNNTYETAKDPLISRYAERYPHITRAWAAWADDFVVAAKKPENPFV